MPVIVCEPNVDDFIELSWPLNAQDPAWIPPIRARLRQELTGADAFGRYAQLRRFGCESGGRLAGRVAAIVNPRLVDAAGHPVGQLGYFEAVDDVTVASTLLEAACGWLRAAGARQIWGPINGGPHRTHRFITEGFDRKPFLFEPRNPPYYPALFAAAGFSPQHTWFSVDVSSAQLRQALDVQPMLQVRAETRGRFTVERADLADAPALLRRLHSLLDPMWSGHVGYYSLDFQEFVEIFTPALSLMTPGDVHIATERDSGRDVGCSLSYPDYAAEVRALDGDATAWGHWRQTGKRPRRLVMHTVGMAPEVRRTGLTSALLRAIFEHCVEGYDEGVMAIVVEELAALQRIAPPTRRHALFARLLG